MPSIEQTSHPADPAPDTVADIASAARALFASECSVTDTLQRLVELATATVEGCDYAGVFLRERGSLTTAVRTDPFVADIDELQHRIGEGPCLDAIAESTAVYAEELIDDPRWPRFGPVAATSGVRSVLALHLSVDDEAAGALNMYARYPRAFGVIDRGRGLILATLAGVALNSARRHADDQRRLDNLAAALATRELIGQAQGILMERERLSADQAFDILRRASQHLNRKLREVAQDLVETGERPVTESSPLLSRSPGEPTGA
jgi:putative methionine-R-sulfoxide reductase with GAF domain